MAPDMVPRFFGPHMKCLKGLIDLHEETIVDLTSTDASVLSKLDLLITGWSAPRLDRAALERLPSLRAVVHAAGSVKAHLHSEVWERGIQVSSATAFNAIPVAEYTLAMILLASKRALSLAHEYAQRQRFIDVGRCYEDIGSNGLEVGLIGASAIGRRVLQLLQHHDLRPVVYDPYVSAADIAALGARKACLEEVMTCPVVSIHAPSSPQTKRMVGARELVLMPEGGTLINTSRGSLLDHDALMDHVLPGRIFAVLDVSDPEPMPQGHPFYSCPHVLLTPHVAGSHGNELPRLGLAAVEEVARLVKGLPLRHPVHAEHLVTSA